MIDAHDIDRRSSAGRAFLKSERTSEGVRIEIGGAWVFDQIAALDRYRTELLAIISHDPPSAAQIGFAPGFELDMTGAWLLHRLENNLADQGWDVTLSESLPRHRGLLDEVRRITHPTPVQPAAPNPLLRRLGAIGQSTVERCAEAARLLSFFGQTMVVLVRTILAPRRLRLTSLTHHLEQTCLNALPIVGLIAFLIGIVMAYQGADQLARFGAEIFTVDLVGVSILREIGILLTAIVVAGRSGSAFTAEIGAMSVNQEIDALHAIGLDPIEILVMPRMLALMIALPLLAFFADMLGLLGGGLMAWLVLDISPAQFLAQLDQAIEPATFWVGIVKAPVFAFLIAMVGCYEGLLVSGSADSVGRHTTNAVVTSIFLVIVFDALFSILFSFLGL